MFYKVKKNSVSNYPVPVINAVVLCLINEDDTEENCVYWIPFTINLSECENKTLEEIDDMIRAEGENLFNNPNNEMIFRAIEIGVDITTPQIL